jgi:hypothetical protein
MRKKEGRGRGRYRHWGYVPPNSRSNDFSVTKKNKKEKREKKRRKISEWRYRQ